jgi:hypothetical protein
LLLGIPLALLGMSPLRESTSRNGGGIDATDVSERVEEIDRNLATLAARVEALQRDGVNEEHADKPVEKTGRAPDDSRRNRSAEKTRIPAPPPATEQHRTVERQVEDVKAMIELLARRIDRLVSGHSPRASSRIPAGAERNDETTTADNAEPPPPSDTTSKNHDLREPAADTDIPTDPDPSRRRTVGPPGAPEDLSNPDIRSLPSASASHQKPSAPRVVLTVARPRAGSAVDRTVDLVAVTKAPGWPVVLIRSDIEGDCWWVQRVVARRGQYIAARVNFGNEDSLSGDQFQLAFLLLDSQHEAVRFQTARQFKELPEGIRRSQVFRYVRR